MGLGSDFDGVGPGVPIGLEDASKYPNLIRVLLERGYSEQEITKICSGNLLRVWRAVEAHATEEIVRALLSREMSCTGMCHPAAHPPEALSGKGIVP